jgi:hypothetical protein
MARPRKECDCLSVCLDANEDIYKDVIGKTLTDPEGLDFVEAFRHAHGRKWSDQGLGG